MPSMLRSQNIPTRLEVGYVGEVYHAWISTYIKNIGWVNGMIEFNSKKWSLMNPIFASNTNGKELKVLWVMVITIQLKIFIKK